MNKLAAGDNIACRCTRCKLVLDHTIVAMSEGSIAKVQCKTCGSNHQYRNAETAPPKTRQTTRRISAKKSPEIAWENSIAEAKGKEYTYQMTGKYRVGDIIDHQVFGRGVVLKIYPDKCDVIFRDGERLMATAG